MSGRPLLELRDLRKRFTGGRGRRGDGAVEAVAGVDLSVARGETVALVGESGSGKTTTGLCALRLLEPDGGEVLFDGEDVLSMDRRRLRRFRRRAQMVFQDTGAALNPRRSAGATLDEVLRVHRLGGGDRGGRRRRAAELLELVGLRPEDVHRFPHEMSGGERQRLGIARSLAVEPELLVLDEPVAALDASVQATVMNLLLTLRDEMDLAYLLIAHDLSLVESLAHRVAVMLEGRVVEEGSREEVLGRPRHPYSQGLLRAIPTLPEGPPGGPSGRLMGP